MLGVRVAVSWHASGCRCVCIHESLPSFSALQATDNGKANGNGSLTEAARREGFWFYGLSYKKEEGKATVDLAPYVDEWKGNCRVSKADWQ